MKLPAWREYQNQPENPPAPPVVIVAVFLKIAILS